MTHVQSHPTIAWPSTPFTVLAVDDDPLMRELMRARLANEHCEVVAAGDGLVALDVLEHQAVDIVLLDLEMPRMNGFEVLARMKAHPRWSRIPVIVVSSLRDVWSIGRAFEAGATSFVIKPFDWPVLECQLKFVLRAHRTRDDAGSQGESGGAARSG